MSNTLFKSGLVTLFVGVSTLSWASDDTDPMNAHKPNFEANETYHADRKEGFQLDDGRMNAQLLADELELSDAFSDPELLAELDLDELESFEYPSEEGLLDDRG